MKLSLLDLKKLFEIGKKAALEAGMYIQSQFDKHYVKQEKTGGDSLASQVVTEVDFKAQAIILSHLDQTITPYDLGLLTEESVDDQSRAVKDYFWCIDPMDGTLPFTEKRTGYAVSIALVSRQGNPVVAIVYIPDINECYTAVKGLGVHLNEKPFTKGIKQTDQVFDVYWDISFKSETYFESVLKQLTLYADKHNLKIKIHTDYGGVRNAIGVMQSKTSSYFKFPKKSNGCGSIWDYAATRLFFEELGLVVANASGGVLNLNHPTTTFMNHSGVLYATDKGLSNYIVNIGVMLK